jgi:hypothetical protein
MKRLNGLLLLLVLVTGSASARIISYAPYSDQISRSAHHQRTTRWFLVTEGGVVVLYDSAGAHEPRIVFPDSGVALIEYAALYESKHAPDGPPMLLINGHLSVDGGATWQNSTGRSPAPASDFDTGGPFVHGLSSSVLPGTDDVPFIIGDRDRYIWAVHRTGAAVQLQASATLVGSNAAGDRFLIQKGGEIRTLDLAGNTTLVTNASSSGIYTGWLTQDGSAYLLASRYDGRYLSLYRSSQRQFIAGPYERAPQFDGDSSQFPRMGSFAVPTHDFNGAWIIQRAPGQPTKLSRHTPAGGLETMWSDPSGPEVEALIAGASGRNLLVQVHRPRQMPGPGPTIRLVADPALAVWQVGQPMPADYDELYLSEEWNKGFIHVDVDRVALGDPFVFNSGVVDPEDESSDFSSGGGGGGEIVQEWGAVRASLKQLLVLPGVARTRGAFGSQWFTDVTIYNPFASAQNVELRFSGLGEESVTAPLAGRSTKLTLAPQEIRVVEDVLQLFGVDNGGGTLYIVPARAVNVTSRTYSRSTGGGTFGFGMYAIDFFNAAGPHFPLTFTGAFPGEQFRTNILLTDTSGRGAEAELRAHRGASVLSSGNTIAAPAGGTAQFNNVAFPSAGPVAQSQQGGALVVRTKRGTTIPMVVAIDNRSNDATYLPPDLASDAPRIIPAIGHLDGANGSRFRSDLYLFNGETNARTILLQATPWDGSRPRSVTFTLESYEARTIPDALLTLFDMTGIARLRYESSGFGGAGWVTGGVRVTSRTYSVDANGATYGCLIPPLNGFQGALSDERLEIVTAVGAGFRTNLALVDLSPAPGFGAYVQVEIYDETGRFVTRFFRNLGKRIGTQDNDLFGSAGSAAPRAARIVVDVLYGGPVAAYATVTDNATNDTTYLAGQLGAKP